MVSLEDSDGHLILYQPGQATTLLAVIAPAVLSTLAVSFVLLRGCVPASWLRRDKSAGPLRERLFFKTHLGAYTASLLLSNLISSSSIMLDIAWLADKGVEQGSLCRLQGALALIGNVGTSYFSMAIAIHTFNALVLRNRHSAWLLCVISLVVGWVVALASGAVSALISTSNLGHALGANGFTCGVSTNYPGVQIGLLVIPVFFSASVMAVFYILILLVLRGTLTFRGGMKLNLNAQARWSIRSNVESLEYQRFIAAMARSMLWFPIVFLLLLMPRNIGALMSSYNMHVSFGFNVFAGACVALLGLADSFIIFSMLRILLPFLGAPPPRTKDMEGFLSPRKSPAESFDASSNEDSSRASIAKSEYSERAGLRPRDPQSVAQRGLFGGLFSKAGPESLSVGSGKGPTLMIPEPAHTRQRFGFGKFRNANRDSMVVSPLLATLASVPLSESPSLPEVNRSNRDSFFQLYSTKTPLPQDISTLSSPGTGGQSQSQRAEKRPTNFSKPSAPAGNSRQPETSKPVESSQEEPVMARSYSPPTRLSAYMERAIRRPSVLDLANLVPEDLPALTATESTKATESAVKSTKSLEDLRNGGRSRTAASNKASRRSAVVRSRSASSAIEIAGTLPHVTVREGPSKSPVTSTTPSLRERAANAPAMPTVVDPALKTSLAKKRRSQSFSSVTSSARPRMAMGLPSNPASSRRNSGSSSTFGSQPVPRSLPGSPTHSRNTSAASSVGLPPPPKLPPGLPASPASSRRSSISSTTFVSRPRTPASPAHSRNASAASSVGLPPPPKLPAGLPGGPASRRSPSASSITPPPSRVPVMRAESPASSIATSLTSVGVSSVAPESSLNAQPSVNRRNRSQRPLPLNAAPSRAMLGLPASPASSIRSRDLTASPAPSVASALPPSRLRDERERMTAPDIAPRDIPASVTRSDASESDKRSRRRSRLPRAQNSTTAAMILASSTAGPDARSNPAPSARRPQNTATPASQIRAPEPTFSRSPPDEPAQVPRQQRSRTPVAATYRPRPHAAPQASKPYGYI